MSVVRMTGEEVLLANQALREWAAGLRRWSRSTREASSAARERMHALRLDTMTSHRTLGGAPQRQGDDVHPQLPSLGHVTVAELVSILVDRHGFDETDAGRALAIGLLVAGYPSDYDVVSAADAFDMVESAIARHP